MGEGVVIDGAPIALDEGTDEEKESGLRLVEIGDELIDYVEFIAGFDHDLRGRMEGVLPCLIQIIQNGLERFAIGRWTLDVGHWLVGLELRDVNLVIS